MSHETNLNLKSVADLVSEKCKFFIPDYQRGYRWEKDQVEDLLADLVEFFQSGKPLYCLQPLVVVLLDSGEWEVVDGQQRLTTLFLILSQLPEGSPKFEIRYKRHEKHFEGSSHTLSALQQQSLDAGDEIPDLHYIGIAAAQIKGFLIDRPERRDLLKRLRDPSAPQVSFIWYQLPKDVSNEKGDSIGAFTRLNAGKILLTDVELIRALFLRGDSELTESERLRIATVWDQMEKRLNEAEFWSFAAPVDYDPVNRIELVFQMVAGRRLEQQDHVLFHHVEERIRNRGLRENWDDLERAFSVLEEWHDDQALFHLIGCLSNTAGAVDTAVWDLYRGCWLSEQITTKDTFRKALKGIIKKRMVGDRTVQEFLDGLDYRDRNSDIKSLLLCYNLASLLSERQGTVRFSFHAFQSQGWDVEHIHAKATEELKGKDLDGILEMYRNYFRRQKSEIADRLAKELGAVLDSHTKADHSVKQVLYKECLGLENVDRDNEEKPDEDALNTLGNLTLLDSKTNRGFKNASFRVKRAWILDPNRQHIYTPPGTRSVFTKSYTAEVEELFRWDLRPSKDGASYHTAMEEVLIAFFEEAESINPKPIKISQATEESAPVPAEVEQKSHDNSQNGTMQVTLPGKTLSFLDLLATYDRIEIPLIQRDYAQGRKSESTARTAFLDSIFTALANDEILNLDFVYGIVNKGEVFHPIDGQQRLTTLFFLHWVAFWKTGKWKYFRKLMGKDRILRFRYCVRPGAERFFPALLKWDPPSELPGAKWFRAELPKQIWFSKNWLNDPTVQGALVMLDAIKAKFENFPQDDLEARLTNIKMEVMALPEAISADEIYLKMNARGKPLTDFEKFKAWLIGQHSSLDVGYEWKLRLDQEWLEFFWGKYRGKEDRGRMVSACFFNTVIALAINHQAGRAPKQNETAEEFGKRINGWTKLGQFYQVAQWNALFDESTIKWVFSSLEALCKHSIQIVEFMKSGNWISKENLVFSDPDIELSFADRCWFHALTLLCQGKCGTDREWLRVARNLILNTDRSNITYFPHTIRSMNNLVEGMNSGVLQRLVRMEDREVDGFMQKSFREQLEEERTKARLLTDANVDWGLIRDAEEHEFLKGQIGILLRDSANETAMVDSGAFAERWRTFKVLMDRRIMNRLIKGIDTDNERLDRLVIRAVLMRCPKIDPKEVLLPWMGESSWGEALKRNADNMQFQKGLLAVIDELIIAGLHGNPEMVVKGLSQITSFGLLSAPAWMVYLAKHGEVILLGSEHWKVRYYHRWWSHEEKAFFVYQRKNVNELEDILVGPEFEVRNDLLDNLVKTGWTLSRARKIASNDRTIFSGHHPELRRDDRKMVFYYQSIELEGDGQNGQKARVRFMDDDAPRKVEDVLDELKKQGMPIDDALCSDASLP